MVGGATDADARGDAGCVDAGFGGAADAGVAGMGDGADAAQIGQFERKRLAEDAADRVAEGDGEVGGVFDENAGLLPAAGDDDDFETGRFEGFMEGLDGDCGGFAPLAVAAEHEVFGGGVEDFGLFGAGVKIEADFGPFGGFLGFGDLDFGRGWELHFGDERGPVGGVWTQFSCRLEDVVPFGPVGHGFHFAFLGALGMLSS